MTYPQVKVPSLQAFTILFAHNKWLQYTNFLTIYPAKYSRSCYFCTKGHDNNKSLDIKSMQAFLSMIRYTFCFLAEGVVLEINTSANKNIAKDKAVDKM